LLQPQNGPFFPFLKPSSLPGTKTEPAYATLFRVVVAIRSIFLRRSASIRTSPSLSLFSILTSIQAPQRRAKKAEEGDKIAKSKITKRRRGGIPLSFFEDVAAAVPRAGDSAVMRLIMGWHASYVLAEDGRWGVGFVPDSTKEAHTALRRPSLVGTNSMRL